MTRMLLVRHGQSEWNAAGRWQGRADPPLSDLGRLQARHAARRIGAVDVIVSSPLQRAAGTAAIVAGELGVGPVLVLDELVERDAGEWSGLTHAQIEEAWPGYLAERRRPPGYEPDGSLRARTAAALARIEADHPDADVLVVTHGGVIYLVEEDHGAPFERVPNLGARWLTRRHGRSELGERLLLTPPEELTVPQQL